MEGKKEQFKKIIKKLLHQFSMFSCPWQTFIWSLSYKKQTLIFKECDVIVRLPLWLVGSSSSKPASRGKQDCPSNPVQMVSGKKRKCLFKKLQSAFRRNKGARQTRSHYWQLITTFKKNAQDLCCLFFNSVLWVFHKLGYKRVVSERDKICWIHWYEKENQR